jgi:ribosomal protein S18 acetylase RimI-like enzyme
MSNALHIDTVPPAEWPTLAAFIAERNAADGDVRCLHSHAGEDATAHADELRALAPEEACYCIARRGDVRVGVVGAEFDGALGRAWLRGPLVAAGEDFPQVAGALLDALCARLPPGLRQHDAFIASDCHEARAFYEARGFVPDAGHDEFIARALPPPFEPESRVRLMPPRPVWRDAIGVLHDAEFPGGYVTADALFEAPAPDRFTRIALFDDAPVGYVHAHFDARWREGYVDFLAAAPTARRHGIGRALLQAAMDWSFDSCEARAMTLTVRADRAAARALYRAAGFERVRTGIGLRRVHAA